jgi:hypothetical protein
MGWGGEVHMRIMDLACTGSGVRITREEEYERDQDGFSWLCLLFIYPSPTFVFAALRSLVPRPHTAKSRPIMLLPTLLLAGLAQALPKALCCGSDALRQSLTVLTPLSIPDRLHRHTCIKLLVEMLSTSRWRPPISPSLRRAPHVHTPRT